MSLPKSVVKCLETYYEGKTCVVTGEFSGTDWHHLDENSKNHTFANVIPLKSQFNQVIERHKREFEGERPYKPLGKLTPEALHERAKIHFEHGSFMKAYACNRLGAFLHNRKNTAPDTAIEFAANALLDLRPISIPELATDTLLRTVKPILGNQAVSNKVKWKTKAILALEIGSYYRDHGLLVEAEHWVDLSDFLARKAGSDVDSNFLARIHQHRGIGYIGTDKLRLADHHLERAREKVDRQRYPFGMTNYVLWKVRLKQRLEYLDETEELLHFAGKQFGRIIQPERFMGAAGLVPADYYSWWTYAEVLLSEIDFALAIGKDGDSKDLASYAHQFLERTQIVPSAVAPPIGLLRYQSQYIKDTSRWIQQRRPADLNAFNEQAKEVFGFLKTD